ncbi:MAG: gliding motility-associated C-terminal domain-containing protein [Bacteroidia bacterium]
MKNLTSLLFIAFICIALKTKACHGLAISGLNITVGATGVTINGSSDGSTCGCGPYWMQAEIACTAAGLTAIPPASLQTILDTWSTPAIVNYNSHPWYNSLLNIPAYTTGNWNGDNCVLEPYHSIFIPFTNLCPGQTYFVAVREYLGGSTASPPTGPWSAAQSFVVPGVATPFNFNLTANPPNYCAPNSSTISITGITGGCGNTSFLWTPGGSTSSTGIVVSPGTTTTYSVTMSSTCKTPITKGITINVGTLPNPAFTPNNTSICTGNALNFTHTGSAGVTHTWSTNPSGGVTITSPNIANPSIVFATAGAYVVTHVVSNGLCTNTITTNITVNAGPNAAFTVPTPTQCLVGNSYNFNATVATGVHSYSFNPSVGAPAVGNIPNYSGSFSAAGTYTVVHSVTNAGCTSTAQSVVVVNPNPSATTNFTNANCGNPNGIIVINNTSPLGQTVVSYTSSLGTVSGQTVNNVPAGTANIGLTNNFGCTFTTNVTVGNSPGITALATTFTNSTCGLNNGIIALGAVTGGSPTYSYNVNGGLYSTSPPLTGLGAGSYTIGVKDINNCVFTKVVTLISLPGPTALAFTTNSTSCVANTGAVNITGVTGGSPAYTFSLNGVASPSTMTSLAAGPKTITVKDANGCTYSTTATVPTVNGPTAATITTQNAACGNANGSATVSAVSGGNPAYQYSYGGGPFVGSNIQGGQVAGPKNVVIKDVNGCTLTVNYVIGNTGSPASALATTSNVSCFGGSNGSFSISTSGGTPGYSYTLTPGNITNGFGNFTGLTAGNYTVNVTDAAGCVATITHTLTQPTQVTLAVTSQSTSCFGGNNGTITVNGSAGTGPYQYNLNGGANQASGTFTNNITANNYNVTVVDSKGCTASQTIAVGQPPALNAVLSTTTANCSAPNGVASVTVGGGTPIYTYTWAPVGGNNAVTTGVSTGNYTVTIKDSKNCTLTAVANVPAALSGTAVITNTTNVSCFGAANGSLTANMVGGTAPLTYTWSNGSSNQVAGGLAPGNYTVTVTDFYGCKSTTVGTITQPALLTLGSATNPAACFNTATGSATTNVISGGTPGFTYLWNPGGATTNTVNGLIIGNYSCTVTDANGCTATQTVNITQPSSITIVTNTLTAACNQSNGAVSATLSGGSAPYTYTWSTGATGAGNTSNLPNMFAGTYTIQVKDVNNCLQTLAATIPNASGPSIAIISQTNVSCFGGNNGIASSQVTGGTAGPGFPTYNWSNGQNTGLSTNLSAGVYTVTATDAAGCITSTNVTITQPSSLTLNVSGTNPKCFNATNGSANAGVAGGTGPYSYAWLPTPGAGATLSTPSGMGPGNYNVTVTDNNGCVISGSVNLANPNPLLASVTTTNLSCFNSANGVAVATTTNAIGAVSYVYVGGPAAITTQTATGLQALSYTLTATDQNTCVATTIFTLSQPALLTVSISATGSVSCSGGSNGFATAAPSGGTPVYNYAWSNGQAVATSTGLAAGPYTVTITDNQGCVASTSVSIIQPAGLTATLTSTNAPCNGQSGSANIAYSGGMGIPSFLWQPGLQVISNPSNLSPGTGTTASSQIHTVQITDGNGCQISKTVTISQPAQIVANISNIINTNCGQANGSATVSASGGAGGYVYQWSSNPSFTNAVISSVVSGAYTVNVQDVNGCNVSAIATINDIQGPTILTQSSSSVICNGQTNGTAAVTATGNVNPVTYLWSYLAQTTSSVNNLPFGLHSVTVKDGANCITSATFNIVQPTQVVTAIGGFTNVTCSGANNGMATVLVNGGNPGYTYSWTPSANTSSLLTNAAPGIYTVVVMDINNCPSSSTVNLTQPNPLLITTNTVININCNGGNNGSVNTTISGGTPIYNLVWAPAQPTNPIITNLTAGTYSLVVTDAQTCSTTAVYNITEPSALVVSSTSTTQATCLPFNNGTASVSINGGSSPYGYSWNTPSPQLSANAASLSPGSWVLTTTDSKGCVITATAIITAAALPSLVATSSNILCNGQANGSASVTASGVAPFTYSWSPNNQTSANINGLTPGTYTAQLTDANGCKTYTSVLITQPAPLSLPVSAPQTICYGNNTGVFAQAAGGTAPYNYTLTNTTSGVNSSSTTAGGIIVNAAYTVNAAFTAVVIDANGCSANAIPGAVTVRPPLEIVGASYTLCDQYKQVLNPSLIQIGNGGPYTFNWSGGLPAQQINTVTANFLNSPNIYSVTISDGCSISTPSATAVFTVVVNPIPTLSVTSTLNKACAPLTVQYTGLSDQSNVSYFWSLSNGSEISNPNGNPMMQTFSPGSYSYNVIVTNQQTGCFNTLNDQFAAEVWPNPIAEFYANPTSAPLLEPTITFTNQSIGASSYFWDFGDYSSNNNTSNAIHPSHLYNLVGTFNVYLVAINSKGCRDTAMHTVEITPDMAVYIPNTFTPDQNGRNDKFLVFGVGIDEEKFKMEIFDRWGELIHSTSNFREGWDGKAKGGDNQAQDGVYVYKILITDLAGKKKTYVGHVTLLK